VTMKAPSGRILWRITGRHVRLLNGWYEALRVVVNQIPCNRVQVICSILLCNRVGIDKQRLGRLVADEFLSLPAENAR